MIVKITEGKINVSINYQSDEDLKEVDKMIAYVRKTLRISNSDMSTKNKIKLITLAFFNLIDSILDKCNCSERDITINYRNGRYDSIDANDFNIEVYSTAINFYGDIFTA